MSVIDEIKKQKLEAMKAGQTVKKDVLNYVLGTVQNLQMTTNQGGKPVTDEQVFKIMREAVVNNEANIVAMKDKAPNVKLLEKAITENEVLNALIPSQLSVEQIREKLAEQTEAIKAAKNDGAAMAICMVFFKKNGDSIDGNLVRQVIQEMRSQP